MHKESLFTTTCIIPVNEFIFCCCGLSPSKVVELIDDDRCSVFIVRVDTTVADEATSLTANKAHTDICYIVIKN